MPRTDFAAYDRIMVVGSGGSGKSWLASRIAAHTGHPVYHLDKEFWRPGWVMTPPEEIVTRTRQMIAAPRWIIEGNYAATMGLRFAAADLVIFLDINRVVCLASAVRRLGRPRPDLPPDVAEPPLWSRDFLEFAQWIWRYPATERPTVLRLHAADPATRFLRITSRRQMRDLLGTPQ